MLDLPSSAAPKKIFISYTHDSKSHSDRVLLLSNQLRGEGFDTDIDQYHANQSWPAWMEAKMEWADNVLVVCTETYLRRWRNQERPGVGLGAQWESFLTRQALYEAPGTNSRFVPVVFERADLGFIPKPLADVTRIVMTDGLGRLVNRLLGIAPAEMPPIRTSLAPIAVAADFFTGSGDGSLFGLREEEELLVSNLFPVSSPPAVSVLRIVPKKKPRSFPKQLQEAWNAVGGAGEAPIGFSVEDGMVYSFEGFTAPVWLELFRRNILEPRPSRNTAQWAQSKSLSEQNSFIKLLNRSLEQLCADSETAYRLIRSKPMKCFLFKADPGKRIGHIKTMALKVEASRMVYKAIPSSSGDPDAIQHWQHEAFRHRFYRFGETWYLVLTPFWAFTADGVNSPSKWQKKSSANMRKPEKNRAVLGHVAFWASILCREGDLLRDASRFILRRPVELKVKPSIKDSDWVKISKEDDREELEKDLAVLL